MKDRIGASALTLGGVGLIGEIGFITADINGADPDLANIGAVVSLGVVFVALVLGHVADRLREDSTAPSAPVQWWE
ncbi:hypothetical protein [Agromyces humi]|uniref:hypothetical protein n=1 Tax=Agromyces humi TaxID=1766800 RepID=UPI001356A063|nr:hypothetical protein [Agromyces humi]